MQHRHLGILLMALMALESWSRGIILVSAGIQPNATQQDYPLDQNRRIRAISIDKVTESSGASSKASLKL